MVLKVGKFRLLLISLLVLPMAVVAQEGGGFGFGSFQTCWGSTSALFGGTTSPYLLNRPIILSDFKNESNCNANLSFTNAGMRDAAVDSEEERVLDNSGCGRLSRCQSSIFDPADVNGSLDGFTLSSPCADGNCPEPHLDRTPSAPYNPVAYDGPSSGIPIDDLQEIPGYTPWSENLSAQVRSYVTGDDAAIGWCGKGVHNILSDKLCIPGVAKADGHNWDNELRNNPNFKEVNCKPEECPPGTILNYEHDQPRPGDPPAGQKGRRWGHVEIVTSNGKGGRTYCSSHCQDNWGGSVRHNKVSAFVYIGDKQCIK